MENLQVTAMQVYFIGIVRNAEQNLSHAEMIKMATTKQTRPFLSGSFHFGGFTDMVQYLGYIGGIHSG